MVNPIRALRRHLPLPVLLAVGLLAGIVAAVAVGEALDGTELRRAWTSLTADPAGVAVALAAFGSAFALRALAWTRVAPGLSFGHALAGIHLTLGANHVLPFRLGEPVRVVSVVRRTGLRPDVAIASTVLLRSIDIIAVLALGLAVAPAAYLDLVGWAGWVVAAVVLALAAGAWRWQARLVDSGAARRPDLAALGLGILAWPAESLLVWQAAHWSGIDLAWTEALLVTTVAVAAQLVAIAPGGFGTYEAAAVAAYATLGVDAGVALVAALSAHALKTAYSLVVGGVALVVPAPSFVGRLRLGPEEQRPVAVAPAPSADAPIVLFMPAHNEQAAVADCIRRAPREIDGHRVEVLVVDDGSTDRTAERARRAGAAVLSLPKNRGLGAAVREGLAAGVARKAAAIAFCDADGEYPPEELAALIRPVLAGEADYVVGSRFLGRIDHMRPHRRLGNVVLTRVLSVIARRRITDGQTGYRAFSPVAAARAEIIHDFNYAQVITLDLLGKGFRYREVPITYHFRTTGESFIRLGAYLRNVVPAVYRELNAG